MKDELQPAIPAKTGTYQRQIEALGHYNVPLVARKGHIRRDIVHEPQLHHDIVAAVDHRVAFPDVLASNLELQFLVGGPGGFLDVDVDFVFRDGLARINDRKRRRGDTLWTADVAVMARGVTLELQDAFAGGIFDESPWSS